MFKLKGGERGRVIAGVDDDVASGTVIVVVGDVRLTMNPADAADLGHAIVLSANRKTAGGNMLYTSRVDRMPSRTGWVLAETESRRAT